MTDTVVSIRAIQFSGRWKEAPQAPHDFKALYAAGTLPTSLTLITWNVDFATDNAAQRLTAALDYLQFHAFPGGHKPPPCLILLQEIEKSAFGTLLAHPWVQEWFTVVPNSPDKGWPKGAWYGTVTLVERSVRLARSTSVHFERSQMGRNALVTDVLIGGAEPHARVLRVVNTHLESLPEGRLSRVVQLGSIARMLEQAGVLVGGIVCGDMNAISPSDETLAEQNGLLDAWKERKRDQRGEKEEEEDGMTWGYQPPCRFPPGRLDRILYTESDAFDVKYVQRVAIGLKMADDAWVSDHFGLLCRVESTSQG